MLYETILLVCLKICSTLALKCYYCEEPSQKIASQIWMHYNFNCRRQRVIACGPSTFACVVVRVTHGEIDFTATGCSEDGFSGCDHHIIPNKNGNLTTLRRCQCSKNLCNINFELDFSSKQFSDDYALLQPTRRYPSLKQISTTTQTLKDFASDRSQILLNVNAKQTFQIAQNLTSDGSKFKIKDSNAYHVKLKAPRKDGLKKVSNNCVQFKCSAIAIIVYCIIMYRYCFYIL